MWWYGYGWWWWWIGFLIIFFLIPLIYGWGYRGWGPWYRRRRQPATGRQGVPSDRVIAEQAIGWGWAGVFLWVVLVIAVVWLIAVFSWPR